MLKEIGIEDMAPWEGQPRKRFSEEKAKQLLHSVRMHGVIQPLVVRMVEGAPARGPMPEGKVRYQIIAGERRWRAAAEAGKKSLMCVLREVSDAEALELALVENLFRDDLDVFEEAEGYKGLLALGWTVVGVAERFGKERGFVHRRLELLGLDEKERVELREGRLSEAAARELAKVPVEHRERALDEVIHPKYSEEPMKRDQAVAHLKAKFVKPAEDAARWELGRKDLERQFPEAVVTGYADGMAMRGHGSGWVPVDGKPKSFEVVERLRADGAEIPCWGDLAEKYGATIHIVPVEDGEGVQRLVERKVVMDGDIVNAKAGECVFPKPRGEGDEKKERQDAQRGKEALLAAVAARNKEEKAFLEDLRTAGLEGLLPALVKARMEVEDGFADVYNQIHGTELKFWEDGASGILEAWVQGIVKKGGLRAWLWLQAANELVGFGSLEYAPVADAVGMKRTDWPLLCGEDTPPGSHDRNTK